MTATSIVHGRPPIGAALLLCLGLGWGCASSKVEPPPDAAKKSVPGPKGSFALALPDGMGYVEPLIERTGTGKAAGSRTVLAAYFVGPDGKEPMATLPTSVEASLTLLGGAPTNVSLTPKPQGTDAWSKARFASEPGDYTQDEIRGELRITAGGKTVTVPIALR